MSWGILMTITARKEREKEMRKKDILGAAEKLFFKKGYENVSMADIAKETELARSTLYLYFKNKEEIYLAIAIRGSKILQKMVTKKYPKAKNGLEKIRVLILAFYQFYKEYPGYYLSRFYYNIPFDEDFPEMEELNKIRVESFKTVTNAFNEGIKDGTIRPDIDPVKTSLYITSSMQNMINLTPTIEMHMKDNDLTHEELIDYTVEMMIHSIQNNNNSSTLK